MRPFLGGSLWRVAVSKAVRVGSTPAPPATPWQPQATGNPADWVGAVGQGACCGCCGGFCRERWDARRSVKPPSMTGLVRFQGSAPLQGVMLVSHCGSEPQVRGFDSFPCSPFRDGRMVRHLTVNQAMGVRFLLSELEYLRHV